MVHVVEYRNKPILSFYYGLDDLRFHAFLNCMNGHAHTNRRIESEVEFCWPEVRLFCEVRVLESMFRTFSHINHSVFDWLFAFLRNIKGNLSYGR